MINTKQIVWMRIELNWNVTEIHLNCTHKKGNRKEKRAGERERNEKRLEIKEIKGKSIFIRNLLNNARNWYDHVQSIELNLTIKNRTLPYFNFFIFLSPFRQNNPYFWLVVDFKPLRKAFF